MSINRKHRRGFTIDCQGILRCTTCSRMQNSVPGSYRLERAIPDDASSILISHELTKPHECLLSTVKRIEALKQQRFIQSELYDSWLSANANNYQLGKSKACMALWDDFSKYRCRREMSKHHDKISWTTKKLAVELRKCPKHKCLYVKNQLERDSYQRGP